MTMFRVALAAALVSLASGAGIKEPKGSKVVQGELRMALLRTSKAATSPDDQSDKGFMCAWFHVE